MFNVYYLCKIVSCIRKGEKTCMPTGNTRLLKTKKNCVIICLKIEHLLVVPRALVGNHFVGVYVFCKCLCLCLCLCYVCVCVMFVFLQMFFSLSLDWEEKGTWSFGISLTEKMEAFVGRCQTTDTSIFSWKMEKETLLISVNETMVAQWSEQLLCNL